VQIREEGTVKNKAVYLAIGQHCSEYTEILGLRIEQTEGAKSWLRVMTELKNRGGEDILIVLVDGLKGLQGRSPPSSRKRMFRPVSCHCSATLCLLPHDTNARRSGER